MNKWPRVEVSAGCVAALCAFCYFDPVGFFAPFCAAVLAHEAGHLLCLRLLGEDVSAIRFFADGARIETRPLPYATEFAAAASGPCINFLLFLAAKRGALLAAFVNLCLLLYNLLPLYPLDGGRMLRAALHLLLSERAARAAERAVAVSCLMLLSFDALWAVWVRRVGLWPLLVLAALLARAGGTVFPLRQKSMDKLPPMCYNATSSRKRSKGK